MEILNKEFKSFFAKCVCASKEWWMNGTISELDFRLHTQSKKRYGNLVDENLLREVANMVDYHIITGVSGQLSYELCVELIESHSYVLID